MCSRTNVAVRWKEVSQPVAMKNGARMEVNVINDHSKLAGMVDGKPNKE